MNSKVLTCKTPEKYQFWRHRMAATLNSSKDSFLEVFSRKKVKYQTEFRNSVCSVKGSLNRAHEHRLIYKILASSR